MSDKTIHSTDFKNEIELMLQNLGFKTISAKNYENNEELELLYETYLYESAQIDYLI